MAGAKLFQMLGPATTANDLSPYVTGVFWDDTKLQASKQVYSPKTILIQNVNNTMAGYQKEILPSSWSPIVKY